MTDRQYAELLRRVKILERRIAGAAATPGAHAASHQNGGLDELDVTTLGGFPGGSGTFLRADATFAAPSASGDTFARKTSDESVTNSTALQDDDTLSFAVGVSEVWFAEYDLFYEGATGGDIKLNFSVPAGASYIAGAQANLVAAAGNDSELRNQTCNSGFDFTFGTAGATNPLYMRILLAFANSTNAGNVTLQWAQNALSGTATKVLAGSCVSARLRT